MLTLGWRLKATDLITSSLIGVLVLLVAGCAGPPPDQSPPPPMAQAAPPPAASPDLAGGPPAAGASPESAPAPPSDDYAASMAPIPNPEDLPPPERERLYGRGHGQNAVQDAPLPPAATAQAAHPASPAASTAHATHVWALNGHPRAERSLRTLHKTHPAAAALRPSQPAPTTPTISDRLAQLGAALRGPVADGSGFSVSDDLAAGKPGAATLTLPPTLFAKIRSEAAKAGLARAAQHLDLVATLSGDGYTITPVGPQTLAAPAAGTPPPAALPAFIWQVQPQPGVAAGPLKADLSARLSGAGTAQALPLLSLERSAKPALAAEPSPPANAAPIWLGEVDLPGLGRIPSASIVGVILLILAVGVLVAAARHTAERERIEQRKSRIAARTAMAAEAARSAPPA